MTTSTVWKAATGALIVLTLAPIRVEATITSVTVDAARDDDNARGYTYAEITVHGTVDRTDGSVGVYTVPAVLIYPRYRRPNRIGVVDWVNSAYYHFFPATTELGTFQFTLLATENYLFDEGYRPLVRRSVVTRRSTHSAWLRSTCSYSSAGPSRVSATRSCSIGIRRATSTCGGSCAPPIIC
jgi:hypothetical protein